MVKTKVAERVKINGSAIQEDQDPVHPEYYTTESIEEAVSLLGKYGRTAKILAGGLDVISLLKRETLPTTPAALISISRIPGLDSISKSESSFMLGATTKLSSLERSGPIREYYPMLATASSAIGGPQVRNMGTVVGNICQDVRCLYYRRPKLTGTDFHCRRKTPEGECYALCGENKEHVIFPGGECAAPCVSDMAVALTAYDARLRITGSSGGRSIIVPELFTPLGKSLCPDEIITSVELPAPGEHVITSFIKFRIRNAIDFAIVSVAAVIGIEDNLICNARIVVGGVAYMPYRDYDAEQFLIGKPLNEKIAAEAAEILTAKAKPLEKNAHKVQITRALVRRAILGQKDA